MRVSVLRLVLPDSIHALTEDTRELLRLLDRAGSIQLHRDDPDGMCFDIVKPNKVDDFDWSIKVGTLVDETTFNAIVALQCPREA